MSDIAARSIRFVYTNWRGETAERWATPSKIWWGRTGYHTELQWLMTAFDHDKGAERDFALADCRFLGGGTETKVHSV
ncbi:hypothetical protein [Roseibium alexandrii]|uniref:hypothetical protein n=1 Tax=Roseibium alexandrii TaxID=388408 RepID=UPI00375298FD